MLGSFAQDALNIDPIIETNLVDELNTPIKFRKSKKYDIDSLSKLSRLTDGTVRRPRKMRTKNMSIIEMANAPKINIKNTDFYFYNKRLFNAATTKNLFVNDLMSRLSIKINSQNIVQNSLIDINKLSYNNSLSLMTVSDNMQLNALLSNMIYANTMKIDDVSTTSIQLDGILANVLLTKIIQTNGISLNKILTDKILLESLLTNTLQANDISLDKMQTNGISLQNMLCNLLQIEEVKFKTFDLFDMSTYNMTDQEMHNIDQTVYAVDQSAFSVVITEEIIRELNNDTRLYAFKNSSTYSAAYLKDFSRLEYNQQLNWLDVFEKNRTCNIEYIEATKMPKIIGEIRLEKNDEYLTEYDLERLELNINALKSRGYDSVLFRFYTNQNLEHIVKLLEHIKTFDLDIYVVYVGLDNRKPEPWNPFVDNEELERYISAIAPYATGWLLNWRSTSQHVKLLPKEFFNYLCNTVRTYNKNCLIYGEIYYGQIDPLRTTALMYNIPQNASGVLINNMGFYGYNHSFIITKLFAKTVPNYDKLHKIAQVVGYRPYYSSKHNLYLDTNEEFEYKKYIENNFNRVNCGTITFIHDGVDDNYTEDYANYQSQDNIIYDYKLKNLIKER